MKNKQKWFKEKTASVSPEIMLEIQLSADIIERIDKILKEKNMTQRDLAQKLNKSEAVVSRWTTGLPNLTLRSIAQLSIALGEPLIQIPVKGLEVLAALNHDAKVSGTAGMTEEEIEKEITAAHAEE
jgi:transcriptional regulator with XRE-family HTH domain